MLAGARGSGRPSGGGRRLRTWARRQQSGNVCEDGQGLDTSPGAPGSAGLSESCHMREAKGGRRSTLPPRFLRRGAARAAASAGNGCAPPAHPRSPLRRPLRSARSAPSQVFCIWWQLWADLRSREGGSGKVSGWLWTGSPLTCEQGKGMLCTLTYGGGNHWFLFKKNNPTL